MIKIEYLLPFNTKDGICKDIPSFTSLINSNADISIKTGKISFKKKNYNYKVELTEVQEQECSVFHITIETSKLSQNFRKMLQMFRKTVGPHLQENIQVIWDGISFEWAKEIYPLIYQVENSMRMLISKFMLIKLGTGWHKLSVPKDVQESIKSENYKPSHGILYEVDFIQLSNFLFKPYSIKDVTKLPQVLNDIPKSGKLTKEKIESIKNYIPKNNWDRYFSELVDFESEEFKRKWQLLYEIRCKVSHNRSMKIDDYTEAKKLCEELTIVIDKAMSKLGAIDISDDDKENISLHTIATVSEPTQKYVNNYISFTDNLSNIVSSDSKKFSFINNISKPLESFTNSSILNQKIMADSLHDKFLTIEKTKNSLLSGDISIAGDSIINSSKLFYNTTNDLLSSFKVDPNVITMPTFSLASQCSIHPKAKVDKKNN